jgi:hypothetical protein
MSIRSPIESAISLKDGLASKFPGNPPPISNTLQSYPYSFARSKIALASVKAFTKDSES